MMQNLVLVFVLLLFLDNSDLVEFKVNPQSPVFEQKGGLLTLSCVVTDDGGEEIKEFNWLKNGVLLPPNTYDRGEDLLELQLDSLKEENSGNYTCKVNDQTKTISVVVYVPPHLDENLKNQRLHLWKNGSIECPVKSSLELSVRWRRNNARVMKGDIYDPTDKTLFFKNVTKENGGKYICEASIPQTGKRYQFEIEVELQDPPTMSSWKGVARATEGSQKSIICAAEGLPKPTFKFYRDDSKKPMVSTSTVTINSEEGKLFWPAVTLEDAGNYTCEASNKLGDDSRLNRLIVLAVPRVTEFSNITFKTGETLRIKCKAVGFPTPKVSIVKILHSGNETLKQVVGNEGESWTVVEYEKPKEQVDVLKDAGVYSCVAENSQGKAENNSFVDILFAPFFSANPNPEEYLLLNHSSNLTCQVFSNPQAKITWTRNDISVDSTKGDVFKVFEEFEGRAFKSTLQITPVVDESGLYSCRAGNVFGEKAEHITVQEAVAPERPDDVVIFEKYSTSMVLGVKDGWNGGNPIVNYKVRYVAPESEPTEVFLEKVQTDEVSESRDYDSLLKIENLSPKTSYSFEVSAINLVGVGFFRGASGETDAMSYPQQVVLEKGKSPCYQPGEVFIRWKEPDSSGSPVEKYRVQYRELTDSGPKQSVTKETTSLQYKLEGLSQSSKYEVKVAAKNAIGWSQDSQSMQFHVCREYVKDASSDIKTISPDWLGLCFCFLSLILG